MNRISKTIFSLSAIGLIGLATFEGFEATPYKDSGGVLTDGFGNTRNVIEGRKVSVLSGLITLNQHVKEIEREINQCVNVGLYQHEFDAMVDLAYNVGAKTVCNSSVVKRANAGDYAGSCEAYLMFDKIRVNGKLVSCHDAKNNCKGIITRRLKERAVCYGQY